MNNVIEKALRNEDVSEKLISKNPILNRIFTNLIFKFVNESDFINENFDQVKGIYDCNRKIKFLEEYVLSSCIFSIFWFALYYKEILNVSFILNGNS